MTQEWEQVDLRPLPIVKSDGQRFKPPFGVVFLPSPFLDEMHPGWIDWLRENKSNAAVVNLAYLSQRLRAANAVPNHAVFIDHPKLRAKAAQRYEDFIKPFQFPPPCCTLWGSYEYWFYHESILQSKYITGAGQELPAWCGPDKVKLNGDGKRWFAGQYTSCAAINILAYLLGWKCTIFVVGNLRKGGHCELSVKMKADWLKREKERGQRPSADNLQWGYLRRQALEQTETEIVHVLPSPTETVPLASEGEALEVLNNGTD